MPRDGWAGTALNLGARRSTGDYLFRLDDDDYYGANYVWDMLLSARCTDADIVSKKAEVLYSTEQETVFRRTKRAFLPTFFQIANFSYKATPAGGFTMMVRRAVAIDRGYPELAYGFADSGFLEREREKNELTMALTDSLNAVVERRDPHTHTWQMVHKWEDATYQRLANPVEDFMV